MGLYERLMGWTEQDVKVHIHVFQAALAEYGRSKITAADAQAIIAADSGAPLTQAEVTEAQTLIATITGNGVAKLARVKEIDDCLLLAETRCPGYSTPTELRAKLGVA